MVDDYPYFHAVRMLYLKNLAILDDVRLDKELKKMSIYIPDRRWLFLLINDRLFAGSIISKQKQTDSGVKTDDVINVVLANTEPPVSPAIAASDYANWLETNKEDLPVVDGAESRMKRQDLIDSFIDSDGEHFSRRIETPVEDKTAGMENDGEKSNNEAQEKMSLDDSYFTETLARVYISQKRYEKALEIISVLSLKYPEKNIYFADQIRYLEKIINIKK